MKKSIAIFLGFVVAFSLFATTVGAQTPFPERPDSRKPAMVTLTFEDGQWAVSAPQAVNASIRNGSCDVQPPEMQYVGEKHDMGINEVNVEILVVVDYNRICWWAWGTWPGSSNGSEAAFYVDSLVERAADHHVMVDVPDYYWQGQPDTSKLPPHTQNEWVIQSSLHLEQFEIRLYSYERQVISGQPPNAWPGLAIDASLYPRNALYYAFLPFASVESPPPACEVSCTGWSIAETYRNYYQNPPLAQSSDGSARTPMGWTNVSSPFTDNFQFMYNGEPAIPPSENLHVLLFRRYSTGWQETASFKSEAEKTGSWSVDCIDLGKSYDDHKLQGGFTISQQGCGVVWCQFNKWLKDPPSEPEPINWQVALLGAIVLLGGMLVMSRRFQITNN